MAQYKLHPNCGVFDESNNYIIPKRGNPEWEAYLTWFRDGGIPTPPDVVKEYVPSLNEIKVAVMAQVDQTAAVVRMRFLANISPGEMAAWATKERLAREYLASDGASDLGVLAIEAGTRGISVGALIVKVLTKATLYYQLEGIICGLNGKHNDIIKNLPTVKDVLNYDYQTGWPTP